MQEDIQERAAITAVLGGRAQAFERIVLRWQLPLMHYLGRLGIPRAESEELTQETFVRAYRHLSRFDPERAAFSTWLFTIARRLAINAIGKARRSEPLDDPDAVAVDADPTCTIDAGRIAARLRSALASLPPKLRSPIALAYLDELSMAEIAAVEGCSVGTIKSRIHRGKERLRPLLADLLEGETP